MKLILGLLGLLLAVVIIGTYSQNFIKSGGTILGAHSPSISINDHAFTLDIAKSEKDKQIGLSNKSKLDQDHGELFIFDKPAKYSFWMRDMKFPIDIIFIRSNKIVQIFNNVPAPKSSTDYLPVYTPKTEADTVLEINAGLSNKYNFKFNDKVDTKNL